MANSHRILRFNDFELNLDTCETASLRATLLDALSSEDATQATSDAQRIDCETVAVQVRSSLRSLLEGATAT